MSVSVKTLPAAGGRRRAVRWKRRAWRRRRRAGSATLRSFCGSGRASHRSPPPQTSAAPPARSAATSPSPARNEPLLGTLEGFARSNDYVQTVRLMRTGDTATGDAE
eukprot:9372696-Pyramimonas_sp.AAC.1